MNRRPLTDVIADVTHVICRLCEQPPGTPCDEDGSVHIARVSGAYQLGRISNEDVLTVLHAACVFTNATLISADGASQGSVMAS
jgi:hypothetical protein